MNGACGKGCRSRQAAFGGSRRGTWAIVLFGLIASACQTTHRADNSNTSWLACEDDRDCEVGGSGLECRDGRCLAGTQPPAPDGAMAGRGTAGRDSGTAGAAAIRDAGTSAPRDAGGADSPAQVTDGGDPCPDGDVVASETDCLLDSAFCRELPDGRYCTGSVPLSCPFPMVPIGEDEPCPEGVICHDSDETRARCQELPLMDTSACHERGGGSRIAADPDHTALFATGCPLGQAEIGRFDFSPSSLPALYGLCCALTVESCAPQAPHFTGDCEGENRYYWTGTSCIAGTGCECTGPECDDGEVSEEVCMSRFAGCAAITERCGGFVGNTCSDDEYCAYVRECGYADGMAICIPRPDSCPDYEDQVCGCDGQTYANLCFANLAGTGMFRFGACD